MELVSGVVLGWLLLLLLLGCWYAAVIVHAVVHVVVVVNVDGVMDIVVVVVISAHALGEQSFNKKGVNADHFEQLIFSFKNA